MNRWAVLALGATTFATASAAQSGPMAQQTSDQLICQLSGDCANAQPAASQEKPRTRGFSIARPGQAAKPVAMSGIATPIARSAVAPTQRYRSAVSSPAAGARFAVAPKPGRADLMITFVSGSATLTEQAKINAQQFVVALGAPQLASMRFAIEGHTDAVGTRVQNLDLSQRRAQAVVDFLTSKSVDKSRFSVKGYGFDRPLNPANPRAGSNRRVEVVKVG